MLHKTVLPSHPRDTHRSVTRPLDFQPRTLSPLRFLPSSYPKPFSFSSASRYQQSQDFYFLFVKKEEDWFIIDMSNLSRSDTVTKAIVAAQEEAACVPLREDDTDDETIRGVLMDFEGGLDTSMFDALSEFKLDLGLSPPSSPTPPASDLPSYNSPPPEVPILSRSFSFASHKSQVVAKKSTKKASTPQHSSTAPAGARGSWRLVKYTGRGTPIDRRRRLEWAGLPGDYVTEDGVLQATTVRSTSLDSALRPSARSVSPEWNYLSANSTSPSQSTHSEPAPHRSPSIYEPPPALGPLEIESSMASDSSDWDLIMNSILAPALEENPETAEYVDAATVVAPTSGSTFNEEVNSMPRHFSVISEEQVQQLHTGLEHDLGLNETLDLGLGQIPGGRVDWFSLGRLPSSRASGYSTPSIYSSQANTTRERTPPPSSDRRSTTSTKADGNEATHIENKSDAHPWWRRIFFPFRKFHNLITLPKDRF